MMLLIKNFAKHLLTALVITATIPSCATHRQGGNHEETLRIAEEAYMYALPLVMMDLTRQVGTHVYELRGYTFGAPLNQFYHMRWMTTAEDRNVVRPNVDTLYSTAWLDLSGGPVIFSKPETDFYASIAVFDAYTNSYNTLGTGGIGGDSAAVYVLCGPGYAGEIPAGSIRVDIPTNMSWLIGRLQYNDNLAYLHGKQDEFLLVPLSEYGNPGFVPPQGVIKEGNLFEPFDKIQEMNIETFFNFFNELALSNPGTEADKPALERFAKIGVGAGLIFNLDNFSPATRQALPGIPAPLIQRLFYLVRGRTVNGWDIFENTIARFGTDYEFRASVALFGLGANPVDMAIYPSTNVNSNFDGRNNYQIRFEAGQLPPADAFWSITAYDGDWFLIPNEYNKYLIRDRDNIVENPDGSVTIYLQHESPGNELFANWLPVPQGLFQLTMRIYLPHESVLNGTWEPPPVTRVN